MGHSGHFNGVLMAGGRELILMRGGICFFSLAGVGEGEGVRRSAALSHLASLLSSGNLLEFTTDRQS